MQDIGPKSLSELKYYIKKDLGWYGKKPIRSCIQRYLFEAGFKFIVWLRITRYLYLKHSCLVWISRMVLKHYSYKYSFDISYKTQIGPDLQIAHFGYIVVASNTVIGKGCRLRLGVVVGKKLTEESTGAIIGDNVDFGVGSKIVGNITIGDNVVVGANAVLTKDVPSNVILAGVPAKIINYKNIKS